MRPHSMSRYNVQPYPEFRNPLPNHGQQPATWTPQNMPTLEPLRPAEPGEAFPDTEKAWWKPNGGSISMLANYKKSTKFKYTKDRNDVCSVYTNSSQKKSGIAQNPMALGLQFNDGTVATIYARFNMKFLQWEPKCISDLGKQTESDMYDIEQHGNDLFVRRNGVLEKAILIE